MNNFEPCPLFDPMNQANLMFLTSVIKVDKKEALRLYLWVGVLSKMIFLGKIFLPDGPPSKKG